MKRFLVLAYLLFMVFVSTALAQVTERVVDIPTRPGVTQRIVLLSPNNPKAAVILFPGGHGGLQISSNRSFKWVKATSWCGRGKCLLRRVCW